MRGGVLLYALAAAALAAPLSAQQAGKLAGRPAQRDSLLTVRVDYVAGSSLYITAGTTQGISVGDTLRVLAASGQRELGRVVVLSSTLKRAVVTFAGHPFAVTRGDTWRVRARGGSSLAGRAASAGSASGAQAPALAGTGSSVAAAPDTTATVATSAAAAGGASGGAEAQTLTAARPSLPPRVDGRLSLDLDASQTASQWGGAASTLGETTPTLRLWAVASRLPAGLQLNLNMRAAYRYATGFTFNTPQSVQVYQASVLKTFQALPLQLELGRFYGPYDAFSGYWDGARFRLGGKSFGIGAAVGYEPQLANEGFSNRVSKISGFLDVHQSAASLRYDAVLSAHQRRVQGDSATYRFLGLSQSLQLASFRVFERLRVDADPATGGWNVSQLQLGGSAGLVGGLRLNVDYDHQRPAPIWAATDIFGVARDRLGGGLSLYGAPGGVSVQLSSIRTQGWASGMSYSSSFEINRTPLAGVGINGSASYWLQGATRTLYLAPGLSREFGRVRASLGYHMYRAEPGSLTRMDGVELGVTLPMRRSIWAMIRVSRDWGAQLTTSRLYLSLWTSF